MTKRKNIILRTKVRLLGRILLASLVFCILFLFTQCFSKEKSTLTLIHDGNFDAVLVTAKYNKMSYANFEEDGVNLYFACSLMNNSSDTIYIPSNDLSVDYMFDDITESLFYILINSDTLFLSSYRTKYEIAPYSLNRITLQRHINPSENKWMNIFKDIYDSNDMLDTLNIYYASPKLDATFNILPPIKFRRALSFRKDTTEYQTYFEGVFHSEDYIEKTAMQ